jgi:hypothetical protein
MDYDLIKVGKMAYVLWSINNSPANANSVAKNLRATFGDKAVIRIYNGQHFVYRKSAKQPAWF